MESGWAKKQDTVIAFATLHGKMTALPRWRALVGTMGQTCPAGKLDLLERQVASSLSGGAGMVLWPRMTSLFIPVENP